MKGGDFAVVLLGILLAIGGILATLALVYPSAIEAFVADIAANVAKVLWICLGISMAAFGIYLIFAVIFKRKFWEED